MGLLRSEGTGVVVVVEMLLAVILVVVEVLSCVLRGRANPRMIEDRIVNNISPLLATAMLTAVRYLIIELNQASSF